MSTDADDRTWVTRAVELATAHASAGGRPFGALVVRDGQVVAEGVNTVAEDRDPLAHAEVQALRAATRALGTEDLTGATIAASCEPCPVCQAAAALMGVTRLVYGASKEEASAIGFPLSPAPAAMQRLWREAGHQAIEQVAVVDAGAPFRAYAER